MISATKSYLSLYHRHRLDYLMWTFFKVWKLVSRLAQSQSSLCPFNKVAFNKKLGLLDEHLTGRYLRWLWTPPTEVFFFRDKFAEKTADFVGISEASFAKKTIGKERPNSWELPKQISLESDWFCADLRKVLFYFFNETRRSYSIYTGSIPQYEIVQVSLFNIIKTIKESGY